MGDILGIGVNSLMAFQYAMTVTSNNVANASTPYYSRRTVDFNEVIFNGGVTIADVNRIYDQVASANLVSNQNQFSYDDSYYNCLIPFEAELEDRNSNITNFINNSIKALSELNTNTSDLTRRQTYLNQLGFLTNRFNRLTDQVNLQMSNTNKSIGNVIDNINVITQKIADINVDIKNVLATDLPALLDQRELLVQQLAEYVNVDEVFLDNNQIALSLNNGFDLVSGSKVTTLAAGIDPSDPQKLQIQAVVGSVDIPLTTLVTSGKLGGLLDYMNKTLQLSANSLGRLSITIADEMNKQNKLGMDAYNKMGQNLFVDINDPIFTNQRVISNKDNTGVASITANITDTTLLTTDDYNMVIDAANHYIISRKSDNSLVTSGAIGAFPAQVTVEGFDLTINSGTFNIGDRYVLSPTRGSAAGFDLNIKDAKLLALAYAATPVPGTQNAGNGSIQEFAVTNGAGSAFSTPGQLSPPIRIEFLSPTSYQIVDGDTNVVMEGPIPYTSGADVFPTPAAYDPGYHFQIKGNNIQAGDKFDIIFNEKGISDNRNGLEMAGLYTKGINNGGKLTFNTSYEALMAKIATQGNALKIDRDTASALLEHAKDQYDAISGVSIQEESTNLMRYQEAFQASAQLIDAARTIFDTIISVTRR
ncbi:MAG: flagellar hook-associated protein FlgK [Gammaproteobacteria bacterium]